MNLSISYRKESADVEQTISGIAEYVIARLKAEGFKVQRYNAYSTNSTYLKLDYGVCNSIRISDHGGKKHLAYRYNVEKGRIVKHSMKQRDLPRFYYGFEHSDILIQDILEARAGKLEMYGVTKYQALMRQNKTNGARQKGFWQQAVEV